MTRYTRSALLAALLFVSACKKENTNEIDVGKPTLPVFTSYIAIGDSQTAGYADDGLYNTGIQNSYPAIIAGQMAAEGGSAFNQPLFSALQANGSGYLKLTGFAATGLPVLTRVATNLAVRGSVTVPGYGSVPLFTKYTGANNNFGIVGLKVTDINNPQYGNVNGYFERLLPLNAPANTTTYLDFATAGNFTFFSCNLGSNDALGYALAGGGDLSSFSDQALFTQDYSLLIDKLTVKGAMGVVSNIPDVSSIPFFTTIKASAILAEVKKIDPTIQTIYISARKSASEGSTDYETRAATDNDMILLTFDPSTIGTYVATSSGPPPYGLTALTPIESANVLDVNEAAILKTRIDGFNAAIEAEAKAKGLALFDARAYLKSLNDGLTINGAALSSAYLTGGVFSLDGVHLTPRGYAVLANQYLLAINAKYGSKLKTVDVTKYSAINLVP